MSILWNSMLTNITLDAGSHTQGVIPLTDYSIVMITGAKALEFLQGQCTCDFKLLATQQWLLGAHCNAKGRMQSSFVAAQLAPDCIALRVHNSIAEQATAILQKYAALSRVKCEISDYLSAAIVGDIGLGIQTLENHHFTVINQQLWLKHTASLTEVWFKNDDPLWKQLQQQPLLPINQWQQLMIEQGVAEVQQATFEQHIPQDFNYDLINAVSFKKGCYTGQEIIARVHYKGQSKKRLHPLHLPDTTATPLVGDSVVNEHNKVLGTVIAVAANAKGFNLLISAALLNDSAERLYLQGKMDKALSHLPLPYAIP